MIKEYRHPLLTGKPCMIHTDFEPYMNTFTNYLALTGCKALITSSFRGVSDKLKGTIVTPAKKSNHFVGFAIDVNLVDDKGVFWNSHTLENPSGKVLDFIQIITDSDLRWGGAFNIPDSVHFDYPLNIKDPARWEAIFQEVQNLLI